MMYNRINRKSRLSFMVLEIFILIPMLNFSCTQKGKIVDTIKLDTLKNGDLLPQGLTRNNKKNGVWNTYYPNKGYLMSVEYFVDDTLDGPSIFYGDTGEVFTVGQYKKGLQEGLWKSYYSYPDKLASKQYYLLDKKVGIWESFDEKGRLILKAKYGPNEKEEILIDNRMPVPADPK